MEKVYNEEFLKKINYYKYLNESVMSKCLQDRLANNDSFDFAMPYMDLIGITAVDHYEAKKMQNNEAVIPGSNLEIYLKEIRKQLLRQPLLFLSLPIAKLPPNTLRKYIPEIDTILNKIRELSHKAQESYQKIKQKQSLTDEEKNNLISFFTYAIKTENQNLHNAQGQLVGYLLNNSTNLGPKVMTFILKYLGYEKARELKLDNTEILVGKLETTNNLGVSYGNNIVINKDTIQKNTFRNNTLENQYGYRQDAKRDGLAILQTLYHELSHQLDGVEAANNKLTNRSFYQATRNLIGTFYDQDEYKRNYAVQEIEKTANRTGWICVGETIKKYMPNVSIPKALDNMFKYEYIEYIQQNTSNKLDSQHQMVYSSDLLTHNLDQIFKAKPSLLTEYSQFLTFYHQNGTPKSTTELLSTPNFYDYEDFYLGQVIYRLKNQGLSFKELATLSISEKEQVIASISRLLYLIYRKMSITNDYINIYKQGIQNVSPKIIAQFDLNYKYYQNFSERLKSIAFKMIEYFPELKDPNLGIAYYFNGPNMIEAMDDKIKKHLEKYYTEKETLNNALGAPNNGGLNGR